MTFTKPPHNTILRKRTQNSKSVARNSVHKNLLTTKTITNLLWMQPYDPKRVNKIRKYPVNFGLKCRQTLDFWLTREKEYILHFDLWLIKYNRKESSKKKRRGRLHCAGVTILDCGFDVGEFKIQLCYSVHFQTNTRGKGMNFPPPPAMA